MVCTGNICRSAFAERALRRALDRREVPDVEVLSAGTHPGIDGPTQAVVEASRRLAIDVTDHVSRRVGPDLLASCDVVLGMEQHHVDFVEALGCDRATTLARFAGEDGDISDPMHYDLDGMVRTLERIDALVEKIAGRLARGYTGSLT